MRDNKLLVQFCKLPENIINMVQWKECNNHQNEIIKWCRENIHPTSGYPHWQLGGRSGGFCIPDVSGDYDDFVPEYYEGIYLGKHEDQVAFALRFPFVTWM